jgi:DNA (cytosine-5)-methyltransferase 1
MKHGSLFSGIGGFDLAAEWMGWENVFHCEWNPFGQRVLNHYWPNAESFNDITKTDFTKYANKIDILTGGFPCQPYSTAGKRLGKEDERHLWPHMLRAIREITPRYVVGENVLGFTHWNGGLVFEEVCIDLENEGYDVQSYILPATGKNAPHRRERVWIVANAINNGNKRESEGIPRASENKRLPKWHNLQQSKEPINLRSKLESFTRWDSFPNEPAFCSGNDGLPTELDGITFPKWRNESIKAYGNAIVPQVVYEIFKAIEKYENL